MAKRIQNPAKKRLSKRQRARRRNWLIFGALVIIVVVGVGVALASLTRDQLGQKIPDLGNNHLSAAPTSYLWNSRPPTSGPHASEIAQWGEHAESVPEWYQVHNLEDAGVIMHYNCPEGCPEIVAELRDILTEMGSNQLILQPYTNMDSRIAVTAWTRLLTLDKMDRGAIVDFIKAYRGIDHHR